MVGGHTITKSQREGHLFSLFLSRLRRYPTAIFSYLMGNWKKDRTRLFSVFFSVAMDEGAAREILIE